MIFQAPKKWAAWIPLAEWWYNTTYHTSLKVSPFQSLYGYAPPMTSEVTVPGPSDSEAKDFLMEKQQMLTKLKENLTQAQARMKKYAHKKRIERSFDLGDMVYLRMQPNRLASFGIRQSIKLTSKFYALLGKRLPAAHGFWLPVAHGPCAAGTTSLVINYP
jgi:hypothetical protein